MPNLKKLRPDATDWASSGEVADTLNVSRRTVVRLIVAKSLKGAKKVKGNWFIKKSAVVDFALKMTNKKK